MFCIIVFTEALIKKSIIVHNGPGIRSIDSTVQRYESLCAEGRRMATKKHSDRITHDLYVPFYLYGVCGRFIGVGQRNCYFGFSEE